MIIRIMITATAIFLATDVEVILIMAQALIVTSKINFDGNVDSDDSPNNRSTFYSNNTASKKKIAVALTIKVVKIDKSRTYRNKNDNSNNRNR